MEPYDYMLPLENAAKNNRLFWKGVFYEIMKANSDGFLEGSTKMLRITTYNLFTYEIHADILMLLKEG